MKNGLLIKIAQRAAINCAITCGNVGILIKNAQNLNKMRQGPQVMAPLLAEMSRFLIKNEQNLNKMRQGPQVIAQFTCGNVGILIKIAQNLNKMRQGAQVKTQLLAEMSEF